MKSKRKFTPEFKVKVILDSLQERDSISVLSQRYSLNAEQINKWKREFKANAIAVFQTVAPKDAEKNSEQEKQKLYEIIGQQKVEIEFLKKKLL
jgi:transposase